MKFNNKGYFDWFDYFPLFLFGGSAFIIPMFIWCNWIASGKQAELYNKHFGTNYTQSDMFWCPNTIMTFINGGLQKTININGSIPVKMVE